MLPLVDLSFGSPFVEHLACYLYGDDLSMLCRMDLVMFVMLRLRMLLHYKLCILLFHAVQ